MVDESIVIDPRLKNRDVRVYALLACSRRGVLATIGERRIGQLLRIRRQNINESIRSLIAAGHVEMLPREPGKRAVYRLTSARFVHQEPPIETQEPAKPQHRPLVKCSQCRRPCRSQTGICRQCKADDRTRQIAGGMARRVVLDTAPQIVREELAKERMVFA